MQANALEFGNRRNRLLSRIEQARPSGLEVPLHLQVSVLTGWYENGFVTGQIWPTNPNRVLGDIHLNPLTISSGYILVDCTPIHLAIAPNY